MRATVQRRVALFRSLNANNGAPLVEAGDLDRHRSDLFDVDLTGLDSRVAVWHPGRKPGTFA